VIIGLVGFIGSGKGTIADNLVQRHRFVKESFADSVKDSVAAVFGWHRHLLEGDTPDSRKWRETKDEWWSNALGKEVTPRWALQLMGTEAGRDVFHPDIWVHTAFRRMDWNPLDHYVIADVRFPNEIKAIQKYGGKVVRVTRGKLPWWYRMAEHHNRAGAYAEWVVNNVHFSEWAWVGTDVDYVFDNNADLEELPKRVDIMLDTLYN
jgi:hypothetical protein